MHLDLKFLRLLSCHTGEVGGGIGVDDAAAGVDEQSAIGVESVAAHLFERTALRAHAGHEEEVIGDNATNVGKEAALRGTDHVHHAIGVGPLAAGAQHVLIEGTTFGIGDELEIMAALVGGERQEDDPTIGVIEEGGDGVFAHVGGDGERVDARLAEESAGIHGRSVADVAALGIGDDELIGMVRANVVDGFLIGLPTFHAEALVESKVGLVGHTVGGGGVDDGFVESKNGIFVLEQVSGDFLQVGVETDTEETAFATNVGNELLTVHLSNDLMTMNAKRTPAHAAAGRKAVPKRGFEPSALKKVQKISPVVGERRGSEAVALVPVKGQG